MRRTNEPNRPHGCASISPNGTMSAEQRVGWVERRRDPSFSRLRLGSRGDGSPSVGRWSCCQANAVGKSISKSCVLSRLLPRPKLRAVVDAKNDERVLLAGFDPGTLISRVPASAPSWPICGNADRRSIVSRIRAPTRRAASGFRSAMYSAMASRCRRARRVNRSLKGRTFAKSRRLPFRRRIHDGRPL